MTHSAPTLTQNADVRFLGRLLGEVIRSYGGDCTVAAHRGDSSRFGGPLSRHRQPAGGLDSSLETLTLDETVPFVRSFMLFSMLANLAEDRQGGASEKDSLASAVTYLSSKGVTHGAKSANCSIRH